MVALSPPFEAFEKAWAEGRNQLVYARLAADLGVPPAAIAFVDDRPENVEGALAAGWTAHLWQDDADTRAWLTELGVLAER